MIAKLTGVIDSSGEGWLIIDVAGVGYLVFCSSRTLGQLTTMSGPVSVLIETHVREDHIHLYGFADAGERDSYKLITTVQGVGAKVGLAILSVLSPDELAQAIAAGDKAAVTRAPGVGPKLATRIISELKDKMGGIVLGAVGTRGAAIEGPAIDAVSALVNLGYGRSDAFAAITQANERMGDGATVEALIREGLAQLGANELRA